MIKLRKILNMLINKFVKYVAKLTTISEKNHVLLVTTIEKDLIRLQKCELLNNKVEEFLYYHKTVIDKYYPTLIDMDTKLLFENKLLIIKKLKVIFIALKFF